MNKTKQSAKLENKATKIKQTHKHKDKDKDKDKEEYEINRRMESLEFLAAGGGSV